MSTKTLNDYICIGSSNEHMTDDDSLQQILHGEEQKNAPKRKRNVRKAIERHFERKRLKNAIGDFDSSANA